ncbi:MAG: hypothetical protein CM15mP112_01760 [Flavobacteriales bacterium]|nr:MAG: hypothetical protein CM15mP112_01760 [Flavobacteriales bacterium]
MIHFLIQLSKKIKLNSFYNLSLYDILFFFYKGVKQGAITTRASSLAFNFFLAFFPSIIVLFTLIPYIPIVDLQETLMELISTILPPNTNEIAFSTIYDIINNPRSGLLSIGFILTIFFATNGVNSLIEAFNSSYHINESRSIVKQRLLSLGITFLLSCILMITILLIMFSKTVVNYLISAEIIENKSIEYILFGKWMVIIIMLFVGISIIYHFGPTIKKKFQLFTPGSIISTCLIIVTSSFFNYYISNFAEYNKVYGSIGTLIIILLWMYINSIILLIGFELNASIFNAKKQKKL